MKENNHISSTDPAEIESLIERVEGGRLRESDTQLVARLLRLALNLVRVLEGKNASIARLKRLLFGPRSEKRRPVGAENSILAMKSPFSDDAAPISSSN